MSVALLSALFKEVAPKIYLSTISRLVMPHLHFADTVSIYMAIKNKKCKKQFFKMLEGTKGPPCSISETIAKICSPLSNFIFSCIDNGYFELFNRCWDEIPNETRGNGWTGHQAWIRLILYMSKLANQGNEQMLEWVLNYAFGKGRKFPFYRPTDFRWRDGPFLAIILSEKDFNVRILKELRSRCANWILNDFSVTFASGNLECSKYMLENGRNCWCGERTYFLSACGRHLYGNYSFTLSRKEAITSAVIECVKSLNYEGFKFSIDLLCAKGNFNINLQIFENTLLYSLTERSADQSADDVFNIFKYAVDKLQYSPSQKFMKEICLAAFGYGYSRFLHNGETIYRRGVNVNFIRYLIETGCISPEHFSWFIIELKRRNWIIDYQFLIHCIEENQYEAAIKVIESVGLISVKDIHELISMTKNGLIHEYLREYLTRNYGYAAESTKKKRKIACDMSF